MSEELTQRWGDRQKKDEGHSDQKSPTKTRMYVGLVVTNPTYIRVLVGLFC